MDKWWDHGEYEGKDTDSRPGYPYEDNRQDYWEAYKFEIVEEK
jgi:hypothetical protein